MLNALRKPPLVANDLYPESSARIIAFVPTRTSHDRMLLVAVTVAMVAAGFMMGLLLHNLPKDVLETGMNFATEMLKPPPVAVLKPVAVAVQPAVMPVSVEPVAAPQIVMPQPPAPILETVPAMEASELLARDVAAASAPVPVPAPEVEAVTEDAAPMVVPQPALFDIKLVRAPSPDFTLSPSDTFERMIKRAQSAVAGGDNETALVLYKQVLDADADNTAALTGAAYIYQVSGSYDQAAEAERRLLALDPADTAASAGLAMALGHSEAESSRKELQKLAEDNPASATMQAALARYLSNHADRRGGFDHLQRAIELEPGNLAYRLDLAVLYDRAGQESEALSLYREVLATTPGGFSSSKWSETPQSALPLNAVRARAAYLAGARVN